MPNKLGLFTPVWRNLKCGKGKDYEKPDLESSRVRICQNNQDKDQHGCLGCDSGHGLGGGEILGLSPAGLHAQQENLLVGVSLCSSACPPSCTQVLALYHWNKQTNLKKKFKDWQKGQGLLAHPLVETQNLMHKSGENGQWVKFLRLFYTRASCTVVPRPFTEVLMWATIRLKEHKRVLRLKASQWKFG